jgi:hypothetical protein
MDKRFIEYLINNKPEGILLDFKGAFYDKLDKPKYNKEIRKDISAFANSTKNKYQSAYIIVGYNEESSTFQDVDYADVGDEAKIQDLVNNVVKPRVTFEIHKLRLNNTDLLVIEIPYSAHKPHFSTQGQVFIRCGSSSQKATIEQINEMSNNIFEKRDVLRPLLNFINSEIPTEYQLDVPKLERMFLEFPRLMTPCFSAFSKGGATFSNRNSNGELVTKSVRNSKDVFLREYNQITNYVYDGKYQEAKELFIKLERSLINDSADFSTLGALVFARNKELPAAEKFINRAIQLQPTDYYINSKIAYVYCLMWKNEKAAIHYEKAIQYFEPFDDDYEMNLTQDLFYLADTYNELGLTGLAFLRYESFLDRLSNEKINIQRVDWSKWKELAIEYTKI